MADSHGDSTSTSTTPTYDVDATRPSVALLGYFTSFDKEKLDKEKANWNSWTWDIYLAMSFDWSYDYVTGDTVAPDTLLKPRALRNWNSNDRSACAFLSSAISDAEWKALSDPPHSNVKAYWEKLKNHHSSDRPVAQVYLLKQVMSIVITSPSESITKRIDKATDLVHCAYTMNSADGLAEETFFSIIALNALGKEHEAIQFQLQDRLQQATLQSPFSFTQIWALLEDKQRLIDVNKCQNNPAATPSSIVLSAQDTNNIILCSNCGKRGHKDRYCISQGGGMAGKTIEESKTQHQLDKEASRSKTRAPGTPSASSQKVRIPYKDANRQALILEVNVNIFQAIPTSTSASFAGIASTPIPTELYSTEALKLEGWMATYDVKSLPEITLPSVPITSEDFVLSTCNQASVGFKLVLNSLIQCLSSLIPVPVHPSALFVKTLSTTDLLPRMMLRD